MTRRRRKRSARIRTHDLAPRLTVHSLRGLKGRAGSAPPVRFRPDSPAYHQYFGVR